MGGWWFMAASCAESLAATTPALLSRCCGPGTALSMRSYKWEWVLRCWYRLSGRCRQLSSNQLPWGPPLGSPVTGSTGG
jgi:hypothetical protein